MVVGKSIITVFTIIVEYWWSVLIAKLPKDIILALKPRVGMTLPRNFKSNRLT